MREYDQPTSDRSTTSGIPGVLLAALAALAVFAGVFYSSIGGSGNVRNRDLRVLATWRGGDVVLVQSDWGTERGYLLEWRDGPEIVDMTGRHATRPTVRVLPDDRLGVIVGEAGDWNMLVLRSPRGPTTAKHYADVVDAEKALDSLPGELRTSKTE